jgi:hypothetical protein
MSNGAISEYGWLCTNSRASTTESVVEIIGVPCLKRQDRTFELQEERPRIVGRLSKICYSKFYLLVLAQILEGLGINQYLSGSCNSRGCHLFGHAVQWFGTITCIC